MSEVIYDSILGKLREAEVNGGTGGGGGTSYVFDSDQFTVSGDSVSITGTVPSAEVASGVDASAVDYRLTVSSGAANFNPIQPIVNVTGNSVTFAPDTAYKMYATTGALNVTANPPAADYWGLEGHAEIFVGSVGYVVFDTSKIVLVNQLEPDSVNNCTLRFHDGMCYVSVEDHVAGYIVVNGSTSGTGSLYYGISTSTNDYVAFDASLNGTPIPLAGAVAEGEKHVVGNGYTETAITGAVDCGTSKFTVANLSLNNVHVTGGTMTLGDAYIPSGSTVAVSGGGLAAEKVSGKGGVIDMNGETGFMVSQQSSYIDNVAITSGYRRNGAAVFVTSGGIASVSNTVFSNCKADSSGGCVYVASSSVIHLNGAVIQNCSAIYGGAVLARTNTNVFMSGCTVSENSASGDGGGIYIFEASVYLNDSVVSGNTNGDIYNNKGNLYLEGSNHIGKCSGGRGTVTLTSGAILDLTGNTNATPIYTSGGVIVDGGCQVITSAGTTVSIAGGTYTKINNDGTTE